MTRVLLPLVLLAAAIGLFLLYTNPTYTQSKELAITAGSYDEALDKSKELKSIRDQLLSKRNTFSNDDVQKLQKVLPDNVDNIRLIIDINNIATRHGLSLKGVSLGETSQSSTNQSTAAVGSSGDPTGSVEVGFTVTASYTDMLVFLHDLEHSMRLIDIEKLSFKGGVSSDYVFTIRTYWLH